MKAKRKQVNKFKSKYEEQNLVNKLQETRRRSVGSVSFKLNQLRSTKLGTFDFSKNGKDMNFHNTSTEIKEGKRKLFPYQPQPNEINLIDLIIKKQLKNQDQYKLESTKEIQKKKLLYEDDEDETQYYLNLSKTKYFESSKSQQIPSFNQNQAFQTHLKMNFSPYKSKNRSNSNGPLINGQPLTKYQYHLEDLLIDKHLRNKQTLQIIDQVEKQFKQSGPGKPKSVMLQFHVEDEEQKYHINLHALTHFASIKHRANSQAGFVDKWKEKYENIQQKHKLDASKKKLNEKKAKDQQNMGNSYHKPYFVKSNDQIQLTNTESNQTISNQQKRKGKTTNKQAVIVEKQKNVTNQAKTPSSIFKIRKSEEIKLYSKAGLILMKHEEEKLKLKKQKSMKRKNINRPEDNAKTDLNHQKISRYEHIDKQGYSRLPSLKGFQKQLSQRRQDEKYLQIPQKKDDFINSGRKAFNHTKHSSNLSKYLNKAIDQIPQRWQFGMSERSIEEDVVVDEYITRKEKQVEVKPNQQALIA